MAFLLYLLMPALLFAQGTPPPTLYKVISKQAWLRSQANDCLELAAIDQGFIHLATKEQLPKVIEKFWANEKYVVLEVKTEKMCGRLVLEKNPGGTTLYYHLYDGKIPMDAVRRL